MNIFWVIGVIAGVVAVYFIGLIFAIEFDKPKYNQPPDQIGNDNEMW